MSVEVKGEEGTVAHEIEGDITPGAATTAATTTNAPAAETAATYPSEARAVGPNSARPVPRGAVSEAVEEAGTRAGRPSRLRWFLDMFSLPQCMHAGFGDTSQPPLFAVGALLSRPLQCEDVFSGSGQCDTWACVLSSSIFQLSVVFYVRGLCVLPPARDNLLRH